jgi:hypothetical protein
MIETDLVSETLVRERTHDDGQLEKQSFRWAVATFHGQKSLDSVFITSSFLGPNILLSSLFLDTLNVRSSVNARYRISQL